MGLRRGLAQGPGWYTVVGAAVTALMAFFGEGFSPLRAVPWGMSRPIAAGPLYDGWAGWLGAGWMRSAGAELIRRNLGWILE